MTRRPDPGPATAPTDTIPSADAPAEDENFLSRWSRRKQAAAVGVPLPEEPPAAPPFPASDSLSPTEVEPIVEKTDADMPPIESLGEESDYSGFMSPKVSSELRRLALRKLFHSPAFNVVDGLDDYDDDFRNFAALGDMITADMIHNEELEAERERERLEKQAEADAKATNEETMEATETAEAQAETAEAAADEEATEQELEEEESLARSEPAVTKEAMDDPDNAKESPDKEST